MKLKTSHAPAGKLKHLALAAALIATSVANAQTFNVASSGINDTTIFSNGPNSNQSTEPLTGVAQADELGEQQNIALYSFNGLATLGAGQIVTSATMNMAFAGGQYPTPTTDTFEIVGFTQAYNPTTVTWGNYSSHATGALQTYGSIPPGIGGPDGTAYAWDITSALNAYLHGEIVGIGIRLNGMTTELLHSFNFASVENPTEAWRPTLTYTVAAIPEPSAVLLFGATAGLGAIRRRRA